MISHSNNAGDLAELERLFKLQKVAALSNPNPPLEERLGWIDQLEAMMIAYRVPVSDALQADFGSHPPVVTDLYETGGVIGRAKYFKRRLCEWLTPRTVEVSKKLHGGAASAEVVLLPKGVVGNIAPWNFPVECALVMVVDMLAAGNRVILKPSLMAPTVAEVISQAIASHFSQDVVSTALGGEELTEKFRHLPWDHLTYTGSARVARIIMRAAAENLVPVTLELGGKNPTVFTEDAIDDDLIRIFLESRIMKGGQVCIAPDYVFVPRRQREEWLTRVKRLWSEMYPTYVGHPDATSAINDAHFNRVIGFVEEARSRGVEVVSLNGDEPDPLTRQIPMYVIVDPPTSLTCMGEEIFGPVLSVMVADGFDDALEMANSVEFGLTSSIFTKDISCAFQFLEQTDVGLTHVNMMTAYREPQLSFGGVKASGHGIPESGKTGIEFFTEHKVAFINYA